MTHNGPLVGDPAAPSVDLLRIPRPENGVRSGNGGSATPIAAVAPRLVPARGTIQSMGAERGEVVREEIGGRLGFGWRERIRRRRQRREQAAVERGVQPVDVGRVRVALVLQPRRAAGEHPGGVGRGHLDGRVRPLVAGRLDRSAADAEHGGVERNRYRDRGTLLGRVVGNEADRLVVARGRVDEVEVTGREGPHRGALAAEAGPGRRAGCAASLHAATVHCEYASWQLVGAPGRDDAVRGAAAACDRVRVLERQRERREHEAGCELELHHEGARMVGVAGQRGREPGRGNHRDRADADLERERRAVRPLRGGSDLAAAAHDHRVTRRRHTRVGALAAVREEVGVRRVRGAGAALPHLRVEDRDRVGVGLDVDADPSGRRRGPRSATSR